MPMIRSHCIASLGGALLAGTPVAAQTSPAQTSLREFVRPAERSQSAGDKTARAAALPAAPRMEEQRIRAELHGRGVVALSDWRLDGDVYRARAEWFGEPVDLHIDATTGDIRQPERLKGTQIETMLKGQGWQVVREVTRGGDTFRVRAGRDSRIYDLEIDSRTGAIIDRRPA